MRRFFLPLVLLVGLASCKDDSQKAADELCDCLSAKAKGFSSDFKKIMKKVGQSETPSTTWKKELAKLDAETQASVQEEANKFVEIDAESIPSCSKKIAEYKVRGKNEEERQKKVLEVMREHSSCEIGTAQWALAMEKMYGAAKDNAAEEEGGDDTEKPKKKKTEEE